MKFTQDQVLTAATELTREAGKLILPFFQASFSHQLKADSSPVTEADFASHHYLVRELSRLEPQLPVVSEESHTPSVQPQAVSQDYWLIDPLDGTKEFMKGKPEFTVNVALMRQHRPVLGIVHAPVLGLTYFAQAGKGAWRQRGQEPAEAIHVRRANVEHLTVVASKDHSGPRVKAMVQRFGQPDLTSIGSSLKFCLVAEGRADVYLRDLPTMEWDTAAAQCVVESAGGLVLDLSGKPLSYGKPGLKNSAFVTVGDPAFPWGELAGGKNHGNGFLRFFESLPLPGERQD